MGSDRARITYDPSRQYRGVVMQQGRVTVEADWNEEEQIVNEEERKEALDFVGPNGTPDNGYRVIETGQVPTPPFDFSVDKGTMYVGGVRTFSADPIQYSGQLDWLDYLHDPDWVDPSTLANAQRKNEFIYLYLREQEVSAVEDSALREVALGGPDTAQRLRFIQHIARLGTDAPDCARAVADAQTKWAAEGLHFDDQTMRLMSRGTLQVSFPDVVTTPDPCEPLAQGGYLGADNQLIRVQISSYDKDARTYRLVWGFDNASFLYRVTVADDFQTLRLQSRPVDDFHKPRANQAVEVLRSAAQLSTITNDYVASATGIVATLETPYSSDTQSITLPALPHLIPLGAEYRDSSQTPVVFLRVWEEEKPFMSGIPVALGTTGLQVTLQAPDNGPFHVGDYWLFAVRPNTAVDPKASIQVFPHRYLEGPQPADGPRLWVCPLAVITWINAVLKTLENGDCRNLFDNLVELSKKQLCACCNITVRPEDLTGTTTLQTIIKGLKNMDYVTVCLTPGTYALSEPLQLGPEHSNLVLEGCQGGVVIQAAAGKENNFQQGLIILTGTDNVTLRGLQFNLPLTPIGPTSGALANIRAVLRPFGGVFPSVSVGIRPLDCTRLTIRDCFFRFSTNSDADITGYGIFASGTCQGLTVQGNTFVREGDVQPQVGESPSRTFFGYHLDSTTVLASGLSNTSIADTIPAGTEVPALLQDASFQDNLFSNIGTAIAIAADTRGIVKVVNNTVENCLAGFKFASDTSNALASLVDEVFVPREQLAPAQRLRTSLLGMTQDPAQMLASVLARGYPLPPGFEPVHTIQVEKQKSSKTFESGKSRVQMFFDKTLSLLNREPLKTATEKVNVKKGATPLPGRIGRLNALHLLLSAFERAALLSVPEGEPIRPFGGPVPPFSLYVSSNDISTIALETVIGTNTAPAFDVNHPLDAFDVNMSANKMQKLGPGPTVSILGGRCIITGNLIVNGTSRHAEGQIAISLSPDDALAVAITGNLFVGNVSLPQRFVSAPPPMDSWEFLNTVFGT